MCVCVYCVYLCTHAREREGEGGRERQREREGERERGREREGEREEGVVGEIERRIRKLFAVFLSTPAGHVCARGARQCCVRVPICLSLSITQS